MPMYEYECEAHGLFEQIRPIAEAREPSGCPDCGEPSRRVISAPHLASMPRSQILARDRNEQSRHEPRVSATPGSCSHAGSCNHGRKAPPGKLKTYTGKRPWVIEHA